MRINFTKMHGCGNDYIYINCFDQVIENPNMLAKSDVADAKMRMFNADGSEGKMCGNAIRCIGKYLYDNQLVLKKEIDIETLSGIKHLVLFVEDGKVSKVSVNMGFANFDPKVIPTTLDHEMINEECIIKKNTYSIAFINFFFFP